MPKDDSLSLLRQQILANRFIPIPPDERNQSGKGDFLPIGIAELTQLIQSGLQADGHMLDLGCGIGRLALPATQYLTANGSYFGIDINLSAIAWCHENIHQKYGNFRFAVINAKNRNYVNPYEFGQQDLNAVVLPIPAKSEFDCIAAFSLFTHLVWEETAWYFQTIPKLLKKTGFLFSTWFLVNPASEAAMKEGRARFRFDLSSSGPAFRLEGGEKYSKAMGYSERDLIALAEKNGLVLATPPRYSGWHTGQLGQDKLIFKLR